MVRLTVVSLQMIEDLVENAEVGKLCKEACAEWMGCCDNVKENRTYQRYVYSLSVFSLPTHSTNHAQYLANDQLRLSNMNPVPALLRLNISPIPNVRQKQMITLLVLF
jgi:hypothetical protein